MKKEKSVKYKPTKQRVSFPKDNCPEKTVHFVLAFKNSSGDTAEYKGLVGEEIAQNILLQSIQNSKIVAKILNHKIEQNSKFPL